MCKKGWAFTWVFLAVIPFMVAQDDRFTIRGVITDGSGEQLLPGVAVFAEEMPSFGVFTDLNGVYSLTLPTGEYSLIFSLLGYREESRKVSLGADVELNIVLQQGILMDEIVVSSNSDDKHVEGAEMGTVELGMEEVARLPALMGEVDVLKVLQLLPGVLSAGEGNSGFYVRGGGPDQNLILLDEAVLYNSGHLLGFFSVFNPDVIQKTTLIKGGMPANYGGRLSSVVDIETRPGDKKTWGVRGGLGLLASRLMVEGPVDKDRSTLMLAGRRAYAFQLAQPFLKGTSFEGTDYYFFDLNARLDYRLSTRDKLFFSTYAGKDVLKYRSKARDLGLDLAYGNRTATLQWNHVFNDQVYFSVTTVLNEYRFETTGRQSEFIFDLYSGVRDENVRLEMTVAGLGRHEVRFGAQYIRHKLTPGIATATSKDNTFSSGLKPKFGREAGFYLQDKFQVSERIFLEGGLRYSLFAQVGPYISPLTSRSYQAGATVASFGGLEPRFSGRYRLTPASSVKASLAVGRQYLHLVSNSTSTLPFDVWVPSSDLVNPQKGIQYALGYFKNWNGNRIETSIEVYYKDLKNMADYRDGYVNDINRDVEESFVFGKGRAYGMELFLKKKQGSLEGWIGYTLSRAERQFQEIEDGRYFPAVYDRTHDVSVVLNYSGVSDWQFGLVFIYGTGRAYTPLKSIYFIEQRPIIHVGARNSARLDPYHRLDLSATWDPVERKSRSFHSSFTFSIYNVYSRLNPLYLFTGYEGDFQQGQIEVEALKVSIFPIIPSITWNFRWGS